jgi:hypothetical protein
MRGSPTGIADMGYDLDESQTRALLSEAIDATGGMWHIPASLRRAKGLVGDCSIAKPAWPAALRPITKAAGVPLIVDRPS